MRYFPRAVDPHNQNITNFKNVKQNHQEMSPARPPERGVQPLGKNKKGGVGEGGVGRARGATLPDGLPIRN